MLTTFQVFNSHMWLVATILDNTNIEQFYYCRKFLDGTGLEKVSAKYDLQARCGLPPVFVNKVLLEHSYSCSCTYCLWLFSFYNGTVEKV